MCLAVDNRLAAQGHVNPLVALKRVPNVLDDHRQTKLVLRELAVLRRVRHPNVLQLRSAFLRPSTVGQCRLIGGKLVHTAMDLYIATEYAEGGDLYSLKGQLSEAQVGAMVWDMLQGTRYLHSVGIWHRDIKSQNAFLFREEDGDGGLVWRVKLGDFGSSVWRGLGGREGLRRALTVEDRDGDGGGDGGGDQLLVDAAARWDSVGGKNNGNNGNNEMGTRAMKTQDDTGSEADSYSDSSVHKVAASRSRNNMNNDPLAGSHLLTRQVCTPCYRAPEVVLSRGGYTDAVDMWGLGCIFGELLSRISYVGSTHNTKLRIAPLFAVRDFPSITPLPGEAFTNTKKELDALFKVIGTPSWRDIEAVPMGEWRAYLRTLPGRAPMMMRRFKQAGEVAIHLLTRLLEFDPSRRLTCDEAMRHEYFDAHREGLEADAEMMVEELSPAVERQLSMKEAEHEGGKSTPIGVALQLLEEELDRIMHEDNGAEERYHRDFFSPTSQRLLAMLTAECEAVAAEHDNVANNANNMNSANDANNANGNVKNRLGKNNNDSKTSLVEDIVMDDADYAMARMSNRADTSAGEGLDASKFLKANRHGEWSEWSSERAGAGRRAAAGGTGGWGVSVSVGGSADAEYAAAIRRQQMK